MILQKSRLQKVNMKAAFSTTAISQTATFPDINLLTANLPAATLVW
jgi:hypothetical protein